MRPTTMALAALLIMLAGCDSDTTESSPPAGLDPGVHRHRLDNGLEVLVVPDHSSPILTAMLTVHSGAFIEEESQSGYSHLLEHMLFKANERQPDSDMFHAELRRRGIESNAATSRDFVAYYFVIPTQHREDGMDLFATSLRSPIFEESSLETEISVVLAEYDRADADPDRVAERRALELLFDRYPNRVDPLGRREAIQHATPDALRELYETFYLPNNACLLFVGDVEADAAFELAERYFGDWSKALDPLRQALVPKHPALKHSVHDLIVTQVEYSRLVVAFQAPSTTSAFRDAVAADLLAAVTLLPDHEFRSLVSPGIMSAVLKHVPSPGKGVFLLELTIEPGLEPNAIDRLRMLGDIAESTTPEQIEVARDRIWMQRAFAGDSSLGLARLLSTDWALGRDDSAPSYLDELYGLEQGDLARVWHDYLADNPASAVVLMAEDSSSSPIQAALERTW